MATSTISTLFKYGRLSAHSEAFFSTPHVYFAPPPTMNDPFECRPWLTFDGSAKEVKDTLYRLNRKVGKLGHDAATKEAARMYDEGRYKDPEVLDALRRDVLGDIGARVGLFCMSRVPDSILMWSHYAQNHAGFCVEFDATDETPVFGAAQPVVYSDSHPIVDFYKTPNGKQVDLIFLTKYLGWAYEQEWRVIDHASGPGLREYPIELMRSVTFGLRMSDDDKTSIRKWVMKRGSQVEFYQARQDDQQFAVRLESSPA